MCTCICTCVWCCAVARTRHVPVPWTELILCNRLTITQHHRYGSPQYISLSVDDTPPKPLCLVCCAISVDAKHPANIEKTGPTPSSAFEKMSNPLLHSESQATSSNHSSFSGHTQFFFFLISFPSPGIFQSSLFPSRCCLSQDQCWHSALSNS